MSNAKIRPLQDKIFVQIIGQSTTPGGIVIPETASDKQQKGLVKAVGPGRFENGKAVALDVKVGDTVLFAKYAGTEVKVDGQDLLVMKEEDIMAIVE